MVPRLLPQVQAAGRGGRHQGPVQGRAFGKSWWAKRWIDVLEGFDIGARLARGRTYARKGQVTAITIEPGKVTAKVQGSRPQPYAVSIEIDHSPRRTGTSSSAS